MAKITDGDRQLYQKKIQPYQLTAKAILKEEEAALLEIKTNPDGAAIQRLALVDKMLNLASNYIIQSGMSQSVLKVRNEDALNEGRKYLYRGVTYLEEIVSNYVDASFFEYEERLAAIVSMDQERRYFLIRKMGLAVQLLENAYGADAKWKWSFVELEGRYAAVAKNILDLKKAAANTDPRAADYESTMYHLALIKKLFVQAADRYREKYEMSSNQIEDFKQAVLFLSGLIRVLTVMGDRNEIEAVKKKRDTWAAKLDADEKKQAEMAAKRK
ncbi:hypothetical protein FACS1894110_22040 [Spirochaetia bacterium]|nr:hypothetical protein FACS1894110_22040 [Spirochaetia bacterium]